MFARQKGKGIPIPFGSEIRNDEADPATFQIPIDPFEGQIQIGTASPRFCLEQLVDQTEDMLASLSGRNPLFDSVTEKRRPDTVVILHGGQA